MYTHTHKQTNTVYKQLTNMDVILLLYHNRQMTSIAIWRTLPFLYLRYTFLTAALPFPLPTGY
jgi:hypothetical protein